jgi:hypothetical protein
MAGVVVRRGVGFTGRFDRYQQEGARETKWFVDGIVKYHRTLQT